MRDDYLAAKEDARVSVPEALRRKYASMTNADYLNEVFDFYGITLRLQAHEKKKIAKNLVLNHLE